MTEVFDSEPAERPSIERQEHEQGLILAAGTQIASRVSLAVGIALAFMLRGSVPGAALAGWLLLHASVHLLILLGIPRWKRSLMTASKPSRQILGLEIAALVKGLSWACAAFLVFPAQDPFLIALFVLTVEALCASSMSTVAVSERAVLGFSAPAGLALAVALMRLDSSAATILGVALVPLPLLILAGARRIQGTISAHIKISIEAESRETILREREQQLAESEEKYRTLFERSEDPMWLISEGHFVMANTAAARFLHYDDVGELVNVHPSALSPLTQAEGRRSDELAEEQMSIAFRDGYHRFDWIHQTKSGTPLDVEVTLTRIPMDGRYGLFCVWRDISDRVARERSLVEAQTLAVEALRAKSEFLATMSHEIRTPLNAVLGMSELLEELRLSGDAGKWAHTIHQSGQSLLLIINDILDLSKIEAKKVELKYEPVDLREMIESVCEVFRVKAESAHIDLLTSIDEHGPVSVMIDPLRVRQILVNLCGNALKFTEQGSVEVSLRSRFTEPGFARFRISVRDTGVGISKKDQPKLFEAFRQADGSTSRRFGGTGLGLTISLRLAQLMNGTLEVESELGLGSNFSFEFTGEIASVDPVAPPSANVDHSPIELSGHVLVVEDVAANRLLAGAMLRKLGMTASFAIDGDDGLSAYRTGEFDLILMDCQMPEMDGFECTRRIRKLEESTPEHIPIVALTANALEGDRERCLDSGMDDFVPKPFRKEQLASVLRRFMPPRQSESAPESECVAEPVPLEVQPQ